MQFLNIKKQKEPWSMGKFELRLQGKYGSGALRVPEPGTITYTLVLSITWPDVKFKFLK